MSRKMRIDGRTLRTAEDAARAYRWVRIASRFVVELLRDGRAIILRFEIGA